MTGRCFLCLEECESKCDYCEDAVYYCCEEHRVLHRQEDVDVGAAELARCRPFLVSSRPDAGRCLLASRDISPGELILLERAVATGPLHDTCPVCLTCFSELDGGFDCPKCGLPFCSPSCASDSIHSAVECGIFSQKPKPQVEVSNKRVAHPFYQCVLPLRILLLSKSRPEAWRAIQQMMDHLSDRPRDSNWNIVQNNVVKYLLQDRKLAEKGFTEADVNHVVGALEVNAFEVEPEGGGKGRAIFPLAALMSHSCVANCRRVRLYFTALTLKFRAGFPECPYVGMDLSPIYGLN